MLLETLLLSPCFLLAKTTVTDSQATLSINKNDLKDDEVLLFFDIDDQTKKHNCNLTKTDKNSHHRAKFRQLLWGNQEGHSLCDLLVFYANSNKRVFCFVELKDNKSDFSKATKQVISTYDAFREKMLSQFSDKYIAKAFIIYAGKGSLPQERKRYQDELNTKFSGRYKNDGKSNEFLEFLRQ